MFDHGRDAYIAELTGEKHFADWCKPIAHRVVGNHLWQLVEDKNTGRRFICLDLLAKQRGGGWGHKDLSEDMGPCAVDCPLSLLDQASPTESQYANAWRTKVREFHASRKAKQSAIKPGAWVTYGGSRYQLIAPLGRKGWEVLSEGGLRMRMKCAQVRAAEVGGTN